jgi:hypothetical protein
MKRRDFMMLAGAAFLSACDDNGSSNSPSVAPSSNASLPQSEPVCRARASSNAPNTIAAENALAGTSDWVLTKPASSRIEGYATTSVNVGSQVSVYVNTESASYSADIYRLGWYGGAGASLKRQLGPLPGTVQAAPSIDPTSGGASCSWDLSFSIDTTGFVTGIYLVKLTTVEGYQQYVYFIVRDDARTGNILFVSSSSTSQAYNPWGGKSLYTRNSTNSIPATAVSYNRPYESNLDSEGAGMILAWDIKVLHFLESHGLDVCYSDILDLHHTAPTGFKCVLISGHSEYWSKQARSNLESAASQGVNVLSLAGNVCYFQVTFDGDLMRCDKTGRDPNTGLFQTLDPEESFFGQTYEGFEAYNVPGDFVLAADIPAWMLTGTRLAPGDKLHGLFGYEADRITSRTPASAVVWGNSPFTTYYNDQKLFGVATYYSSGDRLTGCSYQVLNVGSMNWAYGLGSAGFNVTNPPTNYENADAKQLTLNVINRFTGVS